MTTYAVKKETLATTESWSQWHAAILDTFLCNLTKKSIRYFILRNFEGLPAVNPSKDVDVVVDPRQYKKAASELLKAFGEFGVEYYKTVRYERAHCWYGFSCSRNLSIHIDLISGYSNKGFEYISFDSLYMGTRPYGSYRVLNDSYIALMLLLYKCVGVGQLKPKYRAEIKDIFDKETTASNELCCRYFGEALSRDIFESISKNDFDELERISKKMSIASKKIAAYHHPVKTCIGIVKFVVEKMDRMVFRPGKYRYFIAVEAPDGTGKTTFINHLTDEISRVFLVDKTAVIVRHFRPSILPNLGEVGEKVGAMKQDRDFENPHRNPPAGKLSSLLRMIYYWLDYSFGGFLVARKDAQFCHFGVFDRYIYDFLVDPERSRISLPYQIRLLFAHLTYQPDLIFVLHASPEVVLSRKKELTYREIAAQNKLFKELDGEFSGCVLLDAESSPEQLSRTAVWEIVEKYCVPLKGMYE